MRFRVLGPLRVWDGADWSPIRAAQQRALLAILLLEAGRSVSTDRLVDEIWGEQPPSTAVSTVHGYVLRLRRMLGEGRLVTRGRAYEVVLEEDDLDAPVFERLTEAGTRSAADGKLDIAVTQLSEGLALWQGSALADVPVTPTIGAEAQRLEQSRISALETRLDAQLALGCHAEVVDELHRLVGDHPLRERMWAQLMLALYRCGRRAEALEAYRRAHRTLTEDLGLEPGRPLRELQAAILAEDPALARPSRPERPETAEPGEITPAQLPPDVAAFTGRDVACAQLDSLLSGNAVAICAVAGVAGVGKTALAVHWAHRVADRFPDGQLHVDLRGYASGPPLRPLEALARFLHALGVPPARVPSEVDEAAALYRSRLAGRRVLVLLDNANHPDQVRPLLPNAPGCLVLITSRDRLAGLVARDGAVRLALDTLTPSEAQSLLTRLIGTDQQLQL